MFMEVDVKTFQAFLMQYHHIFKEVSERRVSKVSTSSPGMNVVSVA